MSNVLTARADAAETDRCRHYDAPGSERKCNGCARWYFQCGECEGFNLSLEFFCQRCKEASR